MLLNNEMDDFTIKLGVPNTYGLVQGEANATAPRKQPLSSMSPTIVTKDGKPVMVVGTPGSCIITAVVHTIINVIDYGEHPRGRQRAAFPPAVVVESDNSGGVRAEPRYLEGFRSHGARLRHDGA